MNKQQNRLRQYTDEEKKVFKEHIEKNYGVPSYVLDDNNKDFNVLVYVIPPKKDANFYTLVTRGMGQYNMKLPRGYSAKKISRVELVMLLPGDWDIESTDLKWDWPFRWLRVLAKLPMEQNSWLGYGHGVGNQESFAENTELSGFVLTIPTLAQEDAYKLTLPNGDVINYYLALPVYEEELNFQEENGADALFEKFGENFSVITDINRKNYCAE